MRVKMRQPDLMRVLDVDTEAKLFQDAPLCFNHVTLAADVAFVQQHRTAAPDGDTAASEHTRRLAHMLNAERCVTCLLRRV